MIVIDDHVIASRLAAAGTPGTFDSVAGEGIATTCSWWWRLTSALSGHRSGALSAHFSGLTPVQRDATARTLWLLPQRLTILDFRVLVPAMGALAAKYDLNQLSAEAVVAAELLSARIVLGQDTPKIRETAAARGLDYRVVA